MGAFEARQVHQADGAGSAASWLRARSNVSQPEANSLARHARFVRTRPLLSAAIDELGAAKVRTILRYTTGRTADAFAEAEATILEQARHLDVDDLATVMRAWQRRVDQDGREPKSWDGNQAELVKTYEGTWDLRSALDTSTGAELDAALQAEAEVIRRSLHADGTVLTASQRRAMALMALIRRGVDPERADTQVPPTVIVTVGFSDFVDPESTGTGDLVNQDEHVPVETVRRMACDAQITRVVLGPDGEVLDLGRTTRSTPTRFRRALTARDGRCAFPGCAMPPNRCQPHHIRWWTRDHGPTALWNLVLLCWHHHHLVHEGGWSIARAPNGSLEFRRPNGSILTLPSCAA